MTCGVDQVRWLESICGALGFLLTIYSSGVCPDA